MKFSITKDEKTYRVEDTVFFDFQTKAFKKIFEELRQGDTAEFDNVYVTLLETGRVIVTIKDEDKDDTI